MKEQILTLLQSGVDENIELALQFIEGQGLQSYYEERYKELLTLCNCSLEELFEKTSLNLMEKKLTKIPICVFDLVRLEELHLSFNLLKEIPTEIGNLGSLTVLYLSSDMNKQIPNKLSDFVKSKIIFSDFGN